MHQYRTVMFLLCPLDKTLTVTVQEKPIIPPSSPSDPSMSSSSDNSHCQRFEPLLHQNVSTTRKPILIASVEQPSLSKRLSLMDSKATPLVFTSLKQKCDSYFHTKDMADEKIILHILNCFTQHTCMSVYIKNNRKSLIAMDKDKVWKKLHTCILDERWALELMDELILTHYDSFSSFSDFADHILHCSRLLVNTEYALDESRLILIAQAALPDFLHERSHKLSTTDYDEWCTGMLEAVHEIANIKATIKHTRAPSDSEAYRPAKCTQLATGSATAGGSNSCASSVAPNRSGVAPKGGWAPALTDSERNLLNQHLGCTRCHKFYVPKDHHTSNCPVCDEDLLSHKNYQVLTKAMALKAKAQLTNKPAAGKPIAVLEEVVNTSTDSSNTLGHLANTVNVLMPSPDIGDNAGDDSFVSVPFKVPHISWPCLLQHVGSTVPVKVKALIDNGSFLVLICEDFACELCYVLLLLPELITVSDYGVKSETSLNHYVDIQPSSICQTWSSALVHAVVSPNLCTPLVLGLPFLNVNKLVIDHDTFSVFDKVNNVDICGLHHIKMKSVSENDAKCLNSAAQSKKADHKREHSLVFKMRLDQHLLSKKIWLSNSQFALPVFIIPKADPMVLPQWVNDYHKLNEMTINDPYMMLHVDDILADCAKGKIFGVMDMMNSFFQTQMHPDSVPLTTVSTPFGVYEWL